jgi:hypothetical protein
MERLIDSPMPRPPGLVWHTAGILRYEYRTVRVATHRDRSDGPRGIQLFAKRTFVLQLFQTFRRGMLRHRRKHKYLRRIIRTPPSTKDKVFILPQYLEDMS